MVKANRLHDLYDSLQTQLAADLKANRKANKNAEAKGEASEKAWIELLKDHTPQRYQIDKGFVIDADGQESDFIDIIIYDRQYTPCIFNRKGNLYIPAESVYAVFEAKQELSKENIEYAGNKAESVRRLRRTSAKIVHAGGRYKAKRLFHINAGIVAYRSAWMPPFEKPFRAVISALKGNERLNLGIAVEDGAFEVDYPRRGTARIKNYSPERALAAFAIRLLHRLQNLGTVAAIDYDEYSKLLS